MKGKQRYSMPNPWVNDFRMPGTPRELDERKYRVGQLLKREKDWMTYMYDFGDSWEHKVRLQKILPYDPAVRLPACIGGRRRCPPEDCGGVWGFYEMLEIREDPNARDHEHMKEWLGEPFNPEVFSPPCRHQSVLRHRLQGSREIGLAPPGQFRKLRKRPRPPALVPHRPTRLTNPLVIPPRFILPRPHRPRSRYPTMPLLRCCTCSRAACDS